MINENIVTVCKIGQGADCCKYLVVGNKGFECMKTDPENKNLIDTNWGAQKSAQGDNCDGKEQSELN